MSISLYVNQLRQMRRYRPLPLRPGDNYLDYFGYQEEANGAAEILAHGFHVAVLKFYRGNSHKNYAQKVKHVQGVVSDSNQCVAQATAFTRAGREIVHPDTAGDAVRGSAGARADS